ncbi:class I SAM-dependent methyltransferase [Nibricoccus aquaticus]|uniref:class I SAM-dependent methyltransferase n=1 Tax=Nibricoccus aquaticus TaxID=2576891 RepID=UPI00158630DA|nr:class I SAM-dependent methyltransferase [Nibricoccus aquaticus]
MGESSFCEWAENAEVVALREMSGGLFECESCRLVFRSPMPPDEALRAAYAAMPADSWAYEVPGHWGWIRNCIRELAPNKRVLDVGCFRGDFLETLPKDSVRFGIEPNADAGGIASSRGITMLGRDAMDQLPGNEESFGAIVLMDVAEHVRDPAAVFRHLRRYLAPGGVLLVLTGNSEHWLARRSLPFYWYMSFPIHLVYLGSRYMRWLARTERWTIARELRYTTHFRGRKNHAKDLAQGVALMMWKRWLGKSFLAGALRKMPGIARLDAMKSPPLLFSVHDHFGVALVKPRE